MLEHAKDTVARFWKEIFTEKKLDAIDEVLSPDFTLHDLATKETFTREKFISRLRDTLTAISDVEAIIEDEIASEYDRVVTHVTMRAPRPQRPIYPSTPAPSPSPGSPGGFEFTLTGRSGEHQFRLHISPTGIAASSPGTGGSGSMGMSTGAGAGAGSGKAAKDAPITPYATSPDMVDISGIAISRMTPDGRIGETWFLWEEPRARMELEPEDIQWRWPPWWM